MIAFDMKSPGNIKNADVVVDQERKGGDPDPIKIVTPRRPGSERFGTRDMILLHGESQNA
jgi:hypothetical protein